MKNCVVFLLIYLPFSVFFANAEEQILFESNRDGDLEIYRQVLGR